MKKRTIALLMGIVLTVAVAIVSWIFWHDVFLVWINLFFALFKGLTLRGVLGFILVLIVRQIPIRARKMIQGYVFGILPLRTRVRIRTRIYLAKKHFADMFGGIKSEGFRVFGLHMQGILAIAISAVLVLALSSSIGSLLILAVGWNSIWALLRYWFGWLFRIIQNVLFYIAVKFKLDVVYKWIEDAPVVKNNVERFSAWYGPRRRRHHREMVRRRQRAGRYVKRIRRKVTIPRKSTEPSEDTEA